MATWPNTDDLCERLDGAIYVRFLPDLDLLVVWHGSDSVNVVNPRTGDDVECYTNGAAPERHDPARDQAMRAWIETRIIPRLLAGETEEL